MRDCIHLIAQASSGYGTLGDQNGLELNLGYFGNAAGSGGWGRVWRFKSGYETYADKMAEMQMCGVLNGYIGYSQDYRMTALQGMAAYQLGLEYIPSTNKYYKDGKALTTTSAIDNIWKNIDAEKMRPWYVSRESGADCTSLTNTSFTIATGIWYHSETEVNGTSVRFGTTHPNRSSLSSSSNAFYRNFCNGAWSSPVAITYFIGSKFPCESEEIIETNVNEYYSGLSTEYVDLKLRIHKVQFDLGNNSSSFTLARRELKDGAGQIVIDNNDNSVYLDLYSFRWKPFMDEYIVDDDLETLLLAKWNDNGDLIGYIDADENYISTAVNLCETWDANPKYNGKNVTTLNAPNGYEGASAASILFNDKEHLYICENGKTGENTWDLDESKITGILRNYSEVTYNRTDGTFKKVTTKKFLYKTGYDAVADENGASTGTPILKTTVSGNVVYHIKGVTGVAWVAKTVGTPNSSDVLFPFCAVERVMLENDYSFQYNGVTYTIDTAKSSEVELTITSTGTYYRYWKMRDKDGNVTNEYVQTWNRSGVYSKIWFEKNADGTFTQLEESPIDDGEQNSTTETGKPEDGLILSRMNVLNSDANLKRGDILCTRAWREGNTRGGHVAMYI